VGPPGREEREKDPGRPSKSRKRYVAARGLSLSAGPVPVSDMTVLHMRKTYVSFYKRSTVRCARTRFARARFLCPGWRVRSGTPAPDSWVAGPLPPKDWRAPPRRERGGALRDASVRYWDYVGTGGPGSLGRCDAVRRAGCGVPLAVLGPMNCPAKNTYLTGLRHQRLGTGAIRWVGLPAGPLPNGRDVGGGRRNQIAGVARQRDHIPIGVHDTTER